MPIYRTFVAYSPHYLLTYQKFLLLLPEKQPHHTPQRGGFGRETVWATVFPVAQTVKSFAQVVAPKVILRGSKAFLLSRSSGSFCQENLPISTYSRHGVQYRLKALRRNPCRREASLRYDMDVK